MRLRDREYAVAYKRTNTLDRLDVKSEFSVIKNNFMSWTADPFPIEINGELYVFAEIFLYTKAKGTIGYSKLTKKGFSKWKVVIEEPFHLSFPYLFWHESMLYMCPESHESGELYIYRCVEFPNRWVKDKTILKGDFNDTVLIRKDNKKYMLSYKLNNSLHLLRKDEDKWIDYDITKYCKDSDAIRPAGKTYMLDNNKLVLVTQIGKPTYGSGIVFKEIKIEDFIYEEKELYRILPSDLKYDTLKEYIGLHTFNVTSKYTVIDVIWEEIVIQRIFFRVLRKVFRIFKRK